MRALSQVVLSPTGQGKTFVGSASKLNANVSASQHIAIFQKMPSAKYMVLTVTSNTGAIAGESDDLQRCISLVLKDPTATFIVHFGPKLIQYDPI